jgi:hypothetical protein
MAPKHYPQRRWHHQRRCGVPAAVVLLTAATLIGVNVGPGVAAGFTSHTTSTTGTLSVARLTRSYATGTDDLGAAGGVGGSSYAMTAITNLVIATTSHRFTTLTNTGSVTATFAGTVTATGTSGTMNVAVDKCSVAWSTGLCSQTTTSLRTATSLAGAPSVSYGSLAVNGVVFLRYTFTATSALASATATAAATPTPAAGSDRTAG